MSVSEDYDKVSTTKPKSNSGVGKVPAPPNFKGVPILQFVHEKSSPNYQVWLERLMIAAMLEFQELARFLNKPHKYWVPPEIDSPTAEEEAADVATGGYKREARIKRIMDREELISKMQSNKSKLFAFILSTLSAESLLSLEDLPTYTSTIKTSYDPLSLFEAIELTHSTKFDSDKVMMEMTVKDNYLDIKQNKGESLLLFRKRMELALTGYDAIEIERPSDLDVVSHMMKACDQVRYKGAIDDLKRKVREGERKFPENVHGLYLFLVGRIPDSSRSEYNPPIDSAFVAAEEENELPEAPAANNSAKPPKKKKDAKVPKPCMICPSTMPEEQRLHWVRDCPYLESCHEHIMKSIKKKETVAMVRYACGAGEEDDDRDGWY